MAAQGKATPGYTLYDPTKHKAMLIEHARDHGEVGYLRSEEGGVDWDKLLWLFEGEHSIELPASNNDACVRSYRAAYNKAWKDAEGDPWVSSVPDAQGRPSEIADL